MDARLKSFPKEFTDRLQKIYPPGILPGILRSYLEPRATTLRVNTIKTTHDEVVRELRNAGFEFEIEKRIPNCIYLKACSQKKFERLSVYKNGGIYLQNASCQIPALILDPKPGERVLDLCASPGGKTTQMAALMQNQGSITALEPDPIRFERLKHNVEQQGASNVTCLKIRGEVFARKCLVDSSFQPFDKILVDAPCSGDGTFYINSRAGYTHWSLGFIQEVSDLQKKLLLSALKLVRKGGVVLYSTCSVNPEENEEIISYIIAENKGISPLSLPDFFEKTNLVKQPLMSWNNKTYTGHINKCRRILPSLFFEGFFLSLLFVS